MDKQLLKNISIIALLTTLIISFTIVSNSAFADNQECTTIIACSDFQEKSTQQGNYDSYKNGQSLVRGILNSIYNKYKSVDGLIACGDYCKEHPNKETDKDKLDTDVGIQVLEDVIKEKYPMVSNFLYVQGNHDSEGTKIAKYGKNDFENFSTFALNENHFYEKNVRNSKCDNDMKQISAELNEYLTDKINQKYEKPIFICSHVPIHYSSRTLKKLDGLYSQYLFDVINDAAQQLNIVFLFGHNHQKGYDDILGGSTSFLQPGDSINLCNLNDYNYVTQTLNFVYMNAGYVGYYDQDDENDVSTFLNMSSFSFNNDFLTIDRWKEGQSFPCNLKSKGVEMKVKKKKSPDGIKHIIPANEKIYTSSQIIQLKHFEKHETENPVFFPETSNEAKVISESFVSPNTFDNGLLYISFLLFIVILMVNVLILTNCNQITVKSKRFEI